ncbi:MAG: hypothetical protein BGN92_14680 [Sphingobacteriales bacterium 41-5]|nr:MAG: hypothetical protein ABS67_02175 [Niabella sp. SCN 42-15]OJU24521.1 MAG: hypothetical protein BGN92_14680 [Sphingobacteriales bacterium 41-5]
MKFVLAAVYDDFISANLAQGLLESENITCWLRDENTVTTHPGLTYAVGGIKLMVADAQLERALAIIETTKEEREQENTCPQCGSVNIEYVGPARKSSTVLGTIAIALLSAGAPVPTGSIYRCFDCGQEFEAE